MNPLRQSGFLFSNFKAKSQTPFEKLFEVFKELITYASGDFKEAIKDQSVMNIPLYMVSK